MFGQCLITPTILDSYEFAKSAPPSWKVRAEEGFLAKLRREKAEYPAWVAKGQAFEDTVVRVCNAHHHNRMKTDPIKKGSELFKEVAAKCIGGKFQEKLSKQLDIDGEKVFLFGYCDVTFPTLTIDLKTTLNYKGPSKYLNGHQHLFYSFMRNVPKFQYIVVQWSSEDAITIQAVHTIDYTAPEIGILEADIRIKIANFFDYLRTNNLWQDYYSIFSKN